MSAYKLIFGLVLLSLFSTSWAETTCEVKDCKITITMKIAFAGANDSYIRDAQKEIEDTWNGPNGQTYGDCKCPVIYKVQTKKVNDCVNNPPAGYHCITVTDYNSNPPRNQTNWTGATFYIGYMYGIATGNGGNSQLGWWSNIMSRPVDPNNPGGEHYLDFAHEAGHMMGINDTEGNLMTVTSGPNATVTQDLVDKSVERVCGANACPDRCCCGNGEVDRNKNEACDPMATPVGCPADEYCCPVCCKCYGRVCFPEWGEYDSESACQAGCGPGAKCYYNYQTGCWDCVVQMVVEEVRYDSTKIKQIGTEMHATRNTDIDAIRNLYEGGLLAMPTLRDYVGNERANIIIKGKNNYHVLTADAEIYGIGGGTIDDPTVQITTDYDTLQEIDSGILNPLAAYKEDRIKIEGVGFLEGIKFWFAELMVDNFVPTDAVPNIEPKEPEEIEQPPPEIDEVRPPVAPTGEEFPEGGISEHVLTVEGWAAVWSERGSDGTDMPYMGVLDVEDEEPIEPGYLPEPLIDE